ncbi:MAG TPA: glycoside hydrolase family 36 protein [Thermomicrobiales bacterium]|nr:glycoside hydrolase family 36 protein [Thermomicrobiales bacterium]
MKERGSETHATVGSAYARLEYSTWRVGNDEIALELDAVSGGVRLRRLALTPGAAWELGGDAAPFALVIDGVDIAPSLTVSGGRCWVEGEAVRLAIELTAPIGATVLHLECHDRQAMIRQWLEVVPSAPATLHRVEPVRLAIASPSLQILHTVSGVQRQGGWRPEEGMYRSFRLESTPLGGPVRKHSGLRSSWDETPWAALTGPDPDAGGVLAALEYGGRWELRADRQGTDGPLTLSFAPDGIEPRLGAGERWVSPAAWIGAFPTDLDSAAAVMHRYIRGTVLPPTASDFPWVQYNTWFSYYCELDEQTLLAEADLAAELGVEVFYVDAGWWVGNPMRRDRFSSGLGNWVENRDKFPSGLRAFADEIRARGMHFGIWVEPERVDVRTATTGTWQPDWIARMADGRYVRCPWPQDTDTAWLCFGHPDTQAWAERWIGDLVDGLGVRWLKWDSNYWDVCHSDDHGHGTTDGERAQLEGVYAVMDRLRERFPGLIIENCAGGATRFDFAITRQTHAAWLNDASEPAHRSRFHNAGASYLFPLSMLNAWVTESEHENVNGQDLPDPVWRAVIRSRMIGAMGFSCRIGTWSESTRAVAREEVERYKTEIRPLLRTGAFYHLLPQPEIPSRDLPTPDTWEAYQLSADDGGTHVVLAFRNMSPESRLSVPLRVEPDHEYDIKVEGTSSVRRSGADLRERGIDLTCPPLASAWVTVRRAAGGVS